MNKTQTILAPRGKTEGTKRFLTAVVWTFSIPQTPCVEALEDGRNLKKFVIGGMPLKEARSLSMCP